MSDGLILTIIGCGVVVLFSATRIAVAVIQRRDSFDHRELTRKVEALTDRLGELEQSTEATEAEVQRLATTYGFMERLIGGRSEKKDP